MTIDNCYSEAKEANTGGVFMRVYLEFNDEDCLGTTGKSRSCSGELRGQNSRLTWVRYMKDRICFISRLVDLEFKFDCWGCVMVSQRLIEYLTELIYTL
jgi:hypothetical protein